MPGLFFLFHYLVLAQHLRATKHHFPTYVAHLASCESHMQITQISYQKERTVCERTRPFIFSQKLVHSICLCVRAPRTWQRRSEEWGAWNRELKLVSCWGKVKEQGVAICSLVFFEKTQGSSFLITEYNWLRDTNRNSFCVMKLYNLTFSQKETWSVEH